MRSLSDSPSELQYCCTFGTRNYGQKVKFVTHYLYSTCSTKMGVNGKEATKSESGIGIWGWVSGKIPPQHLNYRSILTAPSTILNKNLGKDAIIVQNCGSHSVSHETENASKGSPCYFIFTFTTYGPMKDPQFKQKYQKNFLNPPQYKMLQPLSAFHWSELWKYPRKPTTTQKENLRGHRLLQICANLNTGKI